MVLLTEERISVAKLARREKKSPVTVWRWTTRGVRGVKLETYCVGNRRYTTEEAWGRFVERTTAAANGEPIPARTVRERSRAIDCAERELEAEGV